MPSIDNSWYPRQCNSIRNGKKIYNKAKTKKQFVKIEGANHNNLSTIYKERYWPPIYELTTK